MAAIQAFRGNCMPMSFARSPASFSSSFSCNVASLRDVPGSPALAPLTPRWTRTRSFDVRDLQVRSSRSAFSKSLVRASGSGNGNRDDAGVIKDMEIYLDDLSLEYDSVWDTKPAWCQPWTIVFTGVVSITASWLVFGDLLLTGFVMIVIVFWWYSFLYAYPLAYSEMISQRRKMIQDGAEDTFGQKRVK